MAPTSYFHCTHSTPGLSRASHVLNEVPFTCKYPPVGIEREGGIPVCRSSVYVRACRRSPLMIAAVILFSVVLLFHKAHYDSTDFTALLGSLYFVSPPHFSLGSSPMQKLAVESLSLSFASWLHPSAEVFCRRFSSSASFFPVALPLGAEAAVVGGVNEDDDAKKKASASALPSATGSSSSQKGKSPSAASPTRDGTGDVRDVEDGRAAASWRDMTEEQRQAVEASKAEILRRSQALEISGLENYQKFHRTHPVSMVMFYASWCVWSRRAMPEFNGLALMMIHRHPPLILAKVDASSEEDIAAYESVMEFPLLKLYVEGRAQQYMGSVMRPPLLSWLNDKLDRDRTLTSPALVDVFVNTGPHNLVVIAAFQRGAPKQVFERLARTLGDDVVFGHVEAPELIEHLKEQHVMRLLDEEDKQLQEQEEGLGKLAASVSAAISAGDLELQRKLETQLGWERQYIEEQKQEHKERKTSVLRAVQRLPFILALSKTNVDPPVHVFDGNPSDLQRLEAFVLRYRFPLLTVLRPQHLPDNFFQDRRPVALLILDSRADPRALRGTGGPRSGGRNASAGGSGGKSGDAGGDEGGPPHPLVAALMKSGTRHRHALVCTVSGNTEPHERFFLDLLGVEDDYLPTIRAMTLQSDGETRVHPEFKYKPTLALMQRLGVPAMPQFGSKAATATTGEPVTEAAAGLGNNSGVAVTAGGMENAASGSNFAASGLTAGGKKGGDDNMGSRGEGMQNDAVVRNQSREPSMETFGGGEQQHVFLTPAVLSAFLDAFVARDVEPYYRSEALPEEEEQLGPRRGTVRTLVGLNYRQILFDNDSDVLVEFYAPWCGHCRKFEPAYKELAARLRDVSGIFLAKVDGNRNEIPGMRVTAYPTLILFPAQTKKKLGSMQTAKSYWYNGDKTVPDILEWLAVRTEKARIDVDRLLAIDLAQRDTDADVGGSVTKSVLEEL